MSGDPVASAIVLDPLTSPREGAHGDIVSLWAASQAGAAPAGGGDCAAGVAAPAASIHAHTPGNAALAAAPATATEYRHSPSPQWSDDDDRRDGLVRSHAPVFGQ